MTGFITATAITGLILIYLLNVPDPKKKKSRNKQSKN